MVTRTGGPARGALTLRARAPSVVDMEGSGGPRRSGDDEDWVGVPPEGRHSRADARPGYWQNQWQAVVARAILPLLALIAVAIILLLR